ncbi:MAG: putative toxin-antitoxin system toxin component, PIN family [Eubacteriales bacterium]|nr:putative toxin-antitoxin system toxin component, PIN family [Eubacteriales bacterium]
MNIVLDTNVLVSALWSADSKPAAIINAVIARKFTACYDYRILDEYDRVLHRPKFAFDDWEINSLLDQIIKNGISVIAEPLPEIVFSDESDKKFFEVAKFCDAYVVTGNIKHYPPDSCILTVADFCEKYLYIK